MRRPIPPGLRLVVKVGSSSLMSGSGGINPERNRARGRPRGRGDQRPGYPTVLVTSGAVASGLPALGLTRRPWTWPACKWRPLSDKAGSWSDTPLASTSTTWWRARCF